MDDMVAVKGVVDPKVLMNLSASGAEFTAGNARVAESATFEGIGTLQLDGAAVVMDVAAGNTNTLFCTVKGSGSVMKTGAGTLALYGANDFSGGLRVAEGVLTADAAHLNSAIPKGPLRMLPAGASV